jgi:hypothetical protein
MGAVALCYDDQWSCTTWRGRFCWAGRVVAWLLKLRKLGFSDCRCVWGLSNVCFVHVAVTCATVLVMCSCCLLDTVGACCVSGRVAGDRRLLLLSCSRTLHVTTIQPCMIVLAVATAARLQHLAVAVSCSGLRRYHFCDALC